MLVQTPYVHDNLATVHEILPKHNPNVVLDQIQMVGSVANA